MRSCSCPRLIPMQMRWALAVRRASPFRLSWRKACPAAGCCYRITVRSSLCATTKKPRACTGGCPQLPRTTPRSATSGMAICCSLSSHRRRSPGVSRRIEAAQQSTTQLGMQQHAQGRPPASACYTTAPSCGAPLLPAGRKSLVIGWDFWGKINPMVGSVGPVYMYNQTLTGELQQLECLSGRPSCALAPRLQVGMPTNLAAAATFDCLQRLSCGSCSCETAHGLPAPSASKQCTARTAAGGHDINSTCVCEPFWASTLCVCSLPRLLCCPAASASRLVVWPALAPAPQAQRGLWQPGAVAGPRVCGSGQVQPVDRHELCPGAHGAQWVGVRAQQGRYGRRPMAAPVRGQDVLPKDVAVPAGLALPLEEALSQPDDCATSRSRHCSRRA